MAIPVGFGGRDTPDFGVSPTAARNVNITDMSELSVRLGSLSWFDRLGSVLMIDAFEQGLGNWIPNAYPADAFPVLSGLYYSKIPYAAKLTTTTDVDSYSGMKKYFPFPYISNFGCEVHFKALTTFDTLYWLLTFYTGIKVYNVQPVIDYDASELQLKNALGTLEKVDDLDITTGANSPFNVLKVSCDLSNEKYVRLIFNNENYLVSSIGISNGASDVSPLLSMLFYLKPYSSIENTIYIDNIVFTTNEPGV